MATVSDAVSPMSDRWPKAGERAVPPRGFNDDLRMFVVLAREKTMAGASRRLGVDQTPVGRRLRALGSEKTTSRKKPPAAGRASIVASP